MLNLRVAKKKVNDDAVLRPAARRISFDRSLSRSFALVCQRIEGGMCGFRSNGDIETTKYEQPNYVRHNFSLRGRRRFDIVSH